MSVKEEDEIGILLSTRNHNMLMCFTNTGRTFRLYAYEIPETQRTAKGQPIVQMLSLGKDEFVTSLMDVTNTSSKYLCLISSKAIVKRINISDVANVRAGGLIVMKPHDGDSLRWVRPTEGDANILLVSE